MSALVSFDSARPGLMSAQMEALYHVSWVLNRSLDLIASLSDVLRILHEKAHLGRGVVVLSDPESGELLVGAALTEDPGRLRTVRYRMGEGLIGAIVAAGKPLIIASPADDPRFLNRLGLADPQRPFIGVPLSAGNDGEIIGVLVAQPLFGNPLLLGQQARFMEMVGNLISQAVRLVLQVTRDSRDITDERDRLRREMGESLSFQRMTGHSAAMRDLYEKIQLVAKWNTTVLVQGESGTGKELVVSAIHALSARSRTPMIKVNCAALPENLLESELFGHERGAFTGAVTTRQGRFELADGGVLFLDEIGETSPAFQAKLLRVLQEGEFERVGGIRPFKVDVRVIAATNRDLSAMVAEGTFRADLFYRLNVMLLSIPPLRERREDIPTLAYALIQKIAKRQQRELRLSTAAVRLLMEHDWPGNVRELENCIERAAVLSPNGQIEKDVVFFVGTEKTSLPKPKIVVPNNEEEVGDERDRIIAALEKSGWVQAKAARILGMTPRQIAYRIKVLAIPVQNF